MNDKEIISYFDGGHRTILHTSTGNEYMLGDYILIRTPNGNWTLGLTYSRDGDMYCRALEMFGSFEAYD